MAGNFKRVRDNGIPSAPATGTRAADWKPGHRAPGEIQNDDFMVKGFGPYGGFYGQLDGVAYGEDEHDKVSDNEQRSFPDCDAGNM
jgi:hypothetical protein